ncbi:hypothetical protein ACWDTP_01185 [Mycobacterium sp. NPDC003449]
MTKRLIELDDDLLGQCFGARRPSPASSGLPGSAGRTDEGFRSMSETQPTNNPRKTSCRYGFTACQLTKIAGRLSASWNASRWADVHLDSIL